MLPYSTYMAASLFIRRYLFTFGNKCIMRPLHKTTKYILTLAGIFIVEMLSTHLLRYRSLLLEDTLMAFIVYTVIVFSVIKLRFFAPPEALKVFALSFLFLQLMA